MAVDRQEIIATNKSLRLIKNELESLLEKGVIGDDVFDKIHAILPAESSLSGASASSTPRNAANPVSPPVNPMANLALNPAAVSPAASPAPPAYHTTGPPSLPARNGSSGPPPPPPAKPVIGQAAALYRYQAADDRDLSFERDDRIAVYEYMNDDWWMGRNQRTGAEGIFPKNYVRLEEKQQQQPPPPQPYYGAPSPAGAGYPPPPQQQNPYNANVPPMAVAEAPSGPPSKAQEQGKKFGKKLGNAAIFGAGATIGGKIVNGIF
ncbi:SH3 domain-containing protein [Xylariomycetidae sp. FL2044]|nr:SH3 domain-containing protein [Xylariomycetidae sp. FL2044]